MDGEGRKGLKESSHGLKECTFKQTSIRNIDPSLSEDIIVRLIVVEGILSHPSTLVRV